MNKNKISSIIMIATFFFTGVVFASSIDINNITGQVGTQISVNVDYISDGTDQNLQYNFTYNPSILTFVSCTGNVIATSGTPTVTPTCSNPSSGQVNFVTVNANFPVVTLASGTISVGTVVFNIAPGAAAGTTPLSLILTKFTPSNAAGVADSDGVVTVTLAPAPVFSSTPADTVALTTINVVQNFGTQTSDLVISNTGNAEPLTGSCSLTTNPSTAFSLSGTATPSFSLLMGGTDTGTVTVACDNTLAVAAYNGVLTCTSNGGADTTYPLVCNVTAPGPAVYGDSPVAGTTTNLTMTSGPLLGGSAQTVTGQDLVLSNTAGAGNNNLEILSCVESAGVPEVTVANPIGANTMIAPGASASSVTFGCDVSGASAAVATFTKTYSCSYSTDGVAATTEGTAVYTYQCSTRAAAAAGSPASGASVALSITAPPGGSANGSVTISETLGEGADLTSASCTLDASATTAGFTISTQPTATIASGTSSDVVITLTDGGTAPLTGIASCRYTQNGSAQLFNINLTGSIRAIIVPTLSYIGYVAMILGLLFVGFVGFRRRA